MLKILRNILPLTVLGVLCACDPIAEGDRYVELEAVEAQRIVLLEEFTGQNCPNCPTAHRTIESLAEQYGQSLISVSIHAGGFAEEEGKYDNLPEPYNFPTFKTPEGDQYANLWGITAYPSGVVNRTSGVTYYTDWAGLVRSELSRPTVLNLSAKAECTDDGLVNIQTSLLSTADVDAHLQLWIVEDGIVSLQLDGSQLLTDYTHNNVYRASVNGVGGEPVSLKANVYGNLTHTIALRSAWNAEKLSVIAFVYNDKDGVLNATKADVK